MALRIEYLKLTERVMIVSCPKNLEEAKADAMKGLALFGADTAQVIDMDRGGKLVGVVKR